MPDAVIIGAGFAGLACAAELQRSGLRALVLERADALGASWRARYDRLRLNTSRWFSRLPRFAYPRGTPLFPARDEVARYLNAFSAHEALEVRLGTRALRIDPRDGGWEIRTESGTLCAHHVIVATGLFREPVVPDWPGRALFRGRLIHSADYRNAAPFREQHTLVVGPGSSGMEIAYDLVRGGAKSVRLSVRTPPTILLRALGRVPLDPTALLLVRCPPRFADWLVGLARRFTLPDLSDLGLPAPAEGPFERLRRTGAGPAVVDYEVIEAIRAREIEIVAAVRALDEAGAQLTDGTRVDASAIVAATGFRAGLESLAGHLDVLDASGEPLVRSGGEALPGLRFIGFQPIPALIFDLGRRARRVARAIAAQEHTAAHRHSTRVRHDPQKDARRASR